MAQPQPQPNIHLYTHQTPNGIKVSMLLEELGLPYTVHTVELGKNEQKEPWFLEINPNGRIPALTDTFSDGKTIRLFESGSIMQYLVERYDTEGKVSYPRGSREAWEVNNWLFWQVGGLGPMQGQAGHFFRYAPIKLQYGIDRYQTETRRLYGIMETQLAKSTSGYLVGDKCTIADIACWGWVAASATSGIRLKEFPNLKAWVDRIVARPGCNRGRNVPKPHTLLEYQNMSDEEIIKSAEEARAWVQQSMKEEAVKQKAREGEKQHEM